MRPLHDTKNELTIRGKSGRASGRLLLFIYAILLSIASGCASRLEKDKTDNTQRGTGRTIDISQLKFTDLDTGDRIDLQAYMEQGNREFVLLLFGSMSCSSCNKKNEYLRDSVVGKHPLYTLERGKSFELVGVNTDLERARDSVQLFRAERRFDFIRLADPRGQTMLNLLPQGDAYGVPFTVLMTRRGVAWLYTNRDHVDIEEILNRVGEDMGLDHTERPAPPTPTPRALPPVVAGRLQIDSPGRLQGVAVHSCGGESLGNLDSQFSESPDVKFVVASRGSCGAACRANLDQVQSACQQPINGRSCRAVGLATEVGCQDAGILRGGSEFFNVFTSFFDWSYPRSFAPDGIHVSIPDMGHLVTIGFDRAGAIVFAQEGALSPDVVTNAMASAGFGRRVGGADFRLYSEVGEQSFSSIRLSSRFTVLNFFDINCVECVQEMATWSRPGGFLDFCRGHSDQCQLLALEDQEDYMERPLSEYFDEVLNGEGPGIAKGLRPSGVQLPLLLDPIVSDLNRPETRLSRIYEGYFKALYGRTSYVGGSIVWDREGKIVDFIGAPFDDPETVFKRVQDLIAQYSAP